MAKKKSWFNIVKRFFIRDTQSKPEKEKRRKWVFGGRLKIKRFPSLTAPLPLKERSSEAEAEAEAKAKAEEEQSKHALKVALASAAAAEAAVTAAQVAAEVVLLTRTPQYNHQCQCEGQQFAAIKIQTAFRGYLARKALRALKGIVKLQAIIRGRAVRRQAITTLKCLQSIVNIQSQVCTRRVQSLEGTLNHDESKQLQNLRDTIIRMDSKGERRWDDSLLSKEDADSLFLSKKEAMIKRERIKDYWFSHRKSAESERNMASGRWRYWLDQWVDTQVSKSRELEDLDSVSTSNPKPGEDCGRKQLKLRNIQGRDNFEGLDFPVSAPRRSFHHRRQCSLGDHNSLSSSPVVPTYMVATESAKAKARSTTSPKVRPGGFDTFSDGYSPSKNKLCLISSIATEVPSSARFGKSSGNYQQRSPSLKGLPGPIKSSRTLKDLSINSDSSLPTWDRHGGFR